MSQFGWKDCPPEVRVQTARLIEDFRRVLDGGLLGVYLHGSLAMGCFNPLRSDIDLLVVTREKMALAAKRGLARSLLDISRQPAPLEISFLAADNLRPWRFPTPYDFHFSEDWREKLERELAGGEWRNWNDRESFDADLAAHITVLNQRGLCLDGLPVNQVFPQVPERDFVASILADVLSEEFGLDGDAVARFPVYVVLNACRTLAFLRTKRVLSKAEGGIWALENLPARHRRTIADALAEYRDGQNDRSSLPKKNLAEFTKYIKNNIERAKT
ncbi:MAG TPA: aminoglycoside adenylyltransferase domain-containing protein [Pyrinomonadaceae bacterium]|jgi:streptomycin 3"-adenylyltransferase